MLFESPSILTILTLFVFGLLKLAINYFEGFNRKNSGGDHFCLSSSVALCPKLVIFGKIILLKWNFVLSFPSRITLVPGLSKDPWKSPKRQITMTTSSIQWVSLKNIYRKCSKIHLKFFFAK